MLTLETCNFYKHICKERESNRLLNQELKYHKQAGEVNLITRCGKIIHKQTNSDTTTVAMDSSTNDQQWLSTLKILTVNMLSVIRKGIIMGSS